MSGSNNAISYETVIESIESINSAALDSAPFILPKSSSTVKQFWLNKDSAGDLLTFPSKVYQCYIYKTAYPELMALLKVINPSLAAEQPDNFNDFARKGQLIQRIQQINSHFAKVVHSQSELEQLMATAKLPEKPHQLLQLWLKQLNSPKSLYLNPYGNNGTITTIPFYQVLEQLPADTLRDKIVMIGFSETIEPEKNLGFYTFFSNAAGQTTSPIEIASTAIANLVDNTWLKPLDKSLQLGLLLLWGTLLSLLGLTYTYRVATPTILIISAVYCYIAYQQFTATQIWLPLIIPIGLQMPMIVIGASILHFRQTHQAKYKMQSILGHLLPKDMVENIPHQPEHLIMNTAGKRVHGICMATDITDFTKLTETIPPEHLIDLMNAYYATVFPLINSHDGYITDLAGDGLYAVWVNPEQTKQKHIDACLSALLIKAAITKFNHSRSHPLITRFGLASGEINIGHTGAPGRYVYRAMGDPANTASRIENLNKHLGTQILVTEEVITDLDPFILRELGFYIVKGKSKAVHVFELMGLKMQTDARTQMLVPAFAKALNHFQHYEWDQAKLAFLQIREKFPDDGPTQFFLRYLEFPRSLTEKQFPTRLLAIDMSQLGFLL